MSGIPEWTFEISPADPAAPVVGSDSCITGIPAATFSIDLIDKTPVLNAGLAQRYLERVSRQQAARVGRALHHAYWQMTRDPQVVEEVGMHKPGCQECRESVNRALARLDEKPDEKLFVGLLYWAELGPSPK
jgi:hypothetical protein